MVIWHFIEGGEGSTICVYPALMQPHTYNVNSSESWSFGISLRVEMGRQSVCIMVIWHFIEGGDGSTICVYPALMQPHTYNVNSSESWSLSISLRVGRGRQSPLCAFL